MELLNFTSHDVVIFKGDEMIVIKPTGPMIKCMDGSDVAMRDFDFAEYGVLPTKSIDRMFVLDPSTIPKGLKKGCGLIVTMPVALILMTKDGSKTFYSYTGLKFDEYDVFSQDVDPESVVRNDHGHIIGCKRLLRYVNDEFYLPNSY